MKGKYLAKPTVIPFFSRGSNVTLKLLSRIAGLAVLGIAVASLGQATPTASRRAVMQIGGGWSVGKPDHGQKSVQGFSIYGDLDFTRHWGIEGDIHRASLVTPTKIGTDSYLLGARYRLQFQKFRPYAKGLLGLGRFKYQYDNATETAYTYKIFSLGGGLDFNATRRINIRAIDYEYQFWPGYPPSGLTPTLFTFGAAYVF
jgi:hypothetical protein